MTTVLTWVCQEGQVHCGPVLLGFSLLPHVLEDEAQPLPCPGPITLVLFNNDHTVMTLRSLILFRKY
jgi:hypothetical protein